MNFVLFPQEGAGEVKFGMTSDQVRGLIPGRFHMFRRWGGDRHPSDHFDLGVFAYYTPDGKLDALEFAAPSAPLFDGVNLLGIGFDEALAFLRSRGAVLEEDPSGAISLNTGVGLYAPYIKESRSIPSESVIAFAPGYYDR